MTGNPLEGGFLRQLNSGSVQEGPLRYPLSATQEIFVGREPNCQIVLDSQQYLMVSRRHASIRPVAELASGQPVWEICDLKSANGTYINGKRLEGCQKLQLGDRLVLGNEGPQFIFEYYPSKTSQTTNVAETQPNSAAKTSLTFTQLFPIVSTGGDLTRKAYLIPGSITVLFVVLMFATLGNAAQFNLLLGVYLAGAAYYFVYQLCGKSKPWWWLMGVAIATIIILLSPLLPLFIVIFRQILPGRIVEGQTSNFAALLVGMFFGAGMMEELLKALPVLGAHAIARQLPSPWKERLGVWEPLDGILLATASAVGFTLLETLGQYVPQIIQEVGELQGLQLLIPRILGSVAGHLAYSGYLGYFIGLSILKPQKRWRILAVGYASASVLHALWNSTVVLGYHVLAVVGILSYAFLTAAILKARTLSPTRPDNFATRFHGK
ncbi:MAG: PrsW family intramembrane metalloprotease [Oscillatoria sp. SIO1A7]|nr:PrsW family intramembrane metalloprotease [Oscillatoria sp. SIO1A7]